MKRIYAPLTGVEDIYIADVTADTDEAYTAGTPEIFAPGIKADWSAEQSEEDFYAANKLQDTFYGIRKEKITFTISGISEEKDAEIRGIAHDTATGRSYSTGKEEPPYKAMGIKLNKGKSDSVNVWFLKGTITGGNIVSETKKDGVTISTREYTFNSLTTSHEFLINSIAQGAAWVKGDTTSENFDETAFFDSVQTPPAVPAT